MVKAQRLVTAEELLRMPEDGKRYELVEGELIELAPPGTEHGGIALNVAAPLRAYVRPRHLGAVVGEVGFRLRRNPDTVRAPDAAFIAQSRLPAGRLPRGYFEGAPDLAVEVVSPEDRPAEVSAKTHEWLEAGARLVWVLWPETRTVTVHPARGDARDLGEADTLDGGDVLPGFSCRVGDLFD